MREELIKKFKEQTEKLKKIEAEELTVRLDMSETTGELAGLCESIDELKEIINTLGTVKTLQSSDVATLLEGYFYGKFKKYEFFAYTNTNRKWRVYSITPYTEVEVDKIFSEDLLEEDINNIRLEIFNNDTNIMLCNPKVSNIVFFNDLESAELFCEVN